MKRMVWVIWAYEIDMAKQLHVYHHVKNGIIHRHLEWDLMNNKDMAGIYVVRVRYQWMNVGVGLLFEQIMWILYDVFATPPIAMHMMTKLGCTIVLPAPVLLSISIHD